MNDKQQLAAIGAQYRLTEEQAKGLAERMPKTGALQVIDDEPLCTEIRINGVEECGADIGGLLDRCLPHTTEQAAQPLCMAKRIEELEAQVRVMTGLLRDAKPYMDHCNGAGVKGYIQISKKIDVALAGQVTAPAAPEGWQLVPVVPTESMIGHGCGASVMVVSEVARAYGAMLAPAPSPDGAK